jgi:hypothetical protein
MSRRGVQDRSAPLHAKRTVKRQRFAFVPVEEVQRVSVALQGGRGRMWGKPHETRWLPIRGHFGARCI